MHNCIDQLEARIAELEAKVYNAYDPGGNYRGAVVSITNNQDEGSVFDADLQEWYEKMEIGDDVTKSLEVMDALLASNWGQRLEILDDQYSFFWNHLLAYNCGDREAAFADLCADIDAVIDTIEM